MGNVLAPSLIPLVGSFAVHALATFRPPALENPITTDIQARQVAEQARLEAEHAVEKAQKAQKRAKRIQHDADKDREQARLCQEEANRAAARAAEEATRMRVEMEEAASAARRARALMEEASRAAREEAERLAQEALEERNRSRRIQEDAEKVVVAVREEAERAQKLANKQRREAEFAKVLAEEAARAAAEETRKAIEAKKDAKRRLKEGIQPIVTPSLEELAAAKRRIQYRDDRFHFAVVGISGSGKSSLINAFRGLSSRDTGAASVGVTETTLQMARYPDANPKKPFVWYDIPGAGTLKCHDWQYFHDQSLYVFDCIIVLFDNYFTMTDVAILANARRFNIPTFIVRSEADQHIRNVLIDMGYGSDEDEDDDDDDEDVALRDRLYNFVWEQFIKETRNSVQTNLEGANLPEQRVYIVSSNTMLKFARYRMPEEAIDEVDLVSDLLIQAYSRRATWLNEMGSAGVNSGS